MTSNNSFCSVAENFEHNERNKLNGLVIICIQSKGKEKLIQEDYMERSAHSATSK